MPSGSLREEAQVVLVEPADVRDSVLDHRDALHAETERVAGHFCGIPAHMAEHAGIDHARARDLDPPGLLADLATRALAHMAAEVHFDARLGEREEVRTETHSAITHHLLREIGKDALEVR